MNDPQANGPANSEIRRLLDNILRSDSELEAFLIDYFPEVYRRISSAMDRLQKTSLLLVIADGNRIVEALRLAFPKQVEQHGAIFHGPSPAFGGAGLASSPPSRPTSGPLPGPQEIFRTKGPSGYDHVEPAAGTPAPATAEAATAGPGGAPQVPSAAPAAAIAVSILHLSDLHFGTLADATRWHSQIATDLRYELSIEKLDAVLVSGDVTNRSERDEYQAAQRFFKELMSEFGLSSQQVVLVPGNHDLSWAASEHAYMPVRRRSYKGGLTPGAYIDAGDYIELRNEADYKERFRAFADFYQLVRLEPYPLEYAEQATVHHFPEQQIVVLGLNSAWEIDHHFTKRASVNGEALSRALTQIRNTPAYGPCLKLALWHHPVQSDGEDRLKDSGFLEQLAQAGFRLGLHGHVHKSDNTLFRYYRHAGGGGIEIVTAGTFGAFTKEWVSGYPLQYQLLRISGRKLRVHTRRREELNGAWKPDARWLQGSGSDPLPYYDIDL